MEDENAWVGVSSDISCSRYDRLHAGPPAWGETGEGSEELTRNIACCHDSPPATIQVRNKVSYHCCRHVSMVFIFRWIKHLIIFTIYRPRQTSPQNPLLTYMKKPRKYMIQNGLIAVRDGVGKLTSKRNNSAIPNLVLYVLFRLFVLWERTTSLLVVPRTA